MNDRTLEDFAYSWIYELINDMSLIESAYDERNDSWRKSVEYAIELKAWHMRYRKVSQLCHLIGGEILEKFEKSFPNGVKTYLKEAS